ncbi:shikimate dehydrogenase [Sporosarcina siberiensis]|uniref:Shikimate dehydrogenase (NADP(+)) n=1 Tax=Sporosarcina siberiensis TaxID=1365606 RepID=A0ABW4SEK6_9BACL
MRKWFAVIGDPIEQSMSPKMHNSWFIENEIDATYIPIHVSKADLKEAVMSLKRLGCSGWNVTVPHKTAIIPFLDHIDPSAKIMNAVNTVEVLSDGTLRGSNTDGIGFVRSLEEAFPGQLDNKKVLIIGAGGAARGIAFALQESNYGPIAFTNRTIEKALELSSELLGSTAMSIESAEASLQEYGLIIQTTSVGMNFSQQGVPLNPENLAEGSIVADIIYNPLETELLTKSLERNALTMNGTGMFVHQGAFAFEKWHGIQPNTEKMIEKITITLGGSYVNR